MEKAKRARKAETLKQTKPFPKVARAVPLSRPWLEDAGVTRALHLKTRGTSMREPSNDYICRVKAFSTFLGRSRHPHAPTVIAISNSRLLSADAGGVTFKYKDYRLEGPERHKTMTLEPDEFIRRFLMHVLPKGFHRIRHYGLLANGGDTRGEARPRSRADR